MSFSDLLCITHYLIIILHFFFLFSFKTHIAPLPGGLLVVISCGGRGSQCLQWWNHW